MVSGEEMLNTSKNLMITKSDAAVRQLGAAMRMWFREDDPVAIHTLAAASHEILHQLNKLGNHDPLLLDSDLIKDEYRKLWIDSVRKHANFFKHADRDPGAVIEFNVDITQYLFIFSMKAMAQMGIRFHVEQIAFSNWCLVHRPEIIKRDAYDQLPVEAIDGLKEASRAEFFAACLAVHSRTLSLP